MKRRVLALGVFLLSVASLGSSTCTQVFSALSINGVQYPLQSSQNYPPPVVSGVIPLNLQFRTVGEAIMVFSGFSLRYTIDNQAVGPVLTNNFAWSLDTSTIPDGRTASRCFSSMNQHPETHAIRSLDVSTHSSFPTTVTPLPGSN